MRIIIQFTRNVRYHFSFGFHKKDMWSSMYWFCFEKWVQYEPDEFLHETEYPVKVWMWGKHPKFWFS